MRRIGLGLAVGAVLLAERADAQVVVPVPKGPDSLALKGDTTRRDSTVKRDTIKAPLIAAEPVLLADPNGSYVWRRDDVFSTGALTAQDLLDRVPGVTGLRSGWISQPMVASFMGDPRRVRVFLDGLELQELDPRMQRTWDLTQIPLWALDDVRVERGATEIRIHMRSWTVNRTTPYTRADVYTGDQATNLYRGLFGRRYGHGEILQLSAQQYGTDPGRNIQGSDQLTAMARLGIARRLWSADAMLLRGNRNRGSALTDPIADSIPAVESTRSDVYVRLGAGAPNRGLWAQTIALASRYVYGGQSSSGGGAVAGADTTRFESQYLVTGGYTRGPWRASVAQRFRAIDSRRFATPSARVGYESTLLTVSAMGEGRGLDSTRRYEISAVVRPTSYLFVAGASGHEAPQGDSILVSTSPHAANFMRAEAGVRARDVWFSGGVLRRDATVIDAPTIVRAETGPLVDDSRQGVFAAVRGRLWKALYADIQGIQWADTAGFYRPKYQTRSELYVSTSMPGRFQPGNFHMLASLVHEYRSHSLWPDTTGVIRVTGYRTISTLIQFKIVDAEVFWQLRNVMRERYAQIPGYQLPRQSNIYGVRWSFWN